MERCFTGLAATTERIRQAIRQAPCVGFDETGVRVPVMVSGAFDKGGATFVSGIAPQGARLPDELHGQDVRRVAAVDEAHRALQRLLTLRSHAGIDHQRPTKGGGAVSPGHHACGERRTFRNWLPKSEVSD